MNLPRLVIIFFVLAIVAGLLNLPGVEFLSLDIARILFGIFLLLFIFSLVMHLFGWKRS